ncbi:peptide chain release factor N(5)-glutamine methyltransferase [Candidatus Woesebacteria bacterium]|nr:peptide chain release factor N(5)-glutamine methyltransferase [Candidatus Woesebacteria bacterium]
MTKTRILTPYERTQLARYLGSSAVTAIPLDIPIEYVTGKVEFCSLVFSITPDALIPRIETEELVHRAERELLLLLAESEPGQRLVVADVGTGCGAVIVTLAHLFRERTDRIHWLASDLSPEATALAEQNAIDILGAQQPIDFFVSDLQRQYPKGLKYDLLIANLPYIPHDRIVFLDKSVHEHEPHLALDGGADGLTLIHDFLTEAKTLVQTKGVILLEIDYTHTADEFNRYRDDWLIRVETDSFTRNRFARLERK